LAEVETALAAHCAVVDAQGFNQFKLMTIRKSTKTICLRNSRRN